LKRVVIFASADSFEGFYGGTFGLDREEFLRTYRNDFIWEYAKGLRTHGHEVFIYILSYGGALLREVSVGLSVRFIPLRSWLRPVDALLFRLRNLPYAPRTRDRIAFAGYGAALNQALAADRIDIFYNQEIWTSRFDLMVQKVRLPVVGADHGAVYSNWMAAGKREAFNRAALLICQSHAGVQRARKLGGNPELMQNGVDIDFFRPAESENRTKTILAVGRFVEAQKRFADLLQAVRSLPDFRLVLVGSGPDDFMLKQMAVNYGIQERVQFTGFVSSREELRSLYQRCGVYVSTSSWEAVALVVLEAMSCGAAVVASRIPSFEDLVTDGDNGLLFPVGDVQALIGAIERAWKHRLKLGTAARDTVTRNYSSAALYKRLSDLIEGAA
jgi:glycosyltransferase involved in cell wall biosynthesis